MSITLKQFDGASVTPKDDAIFNNLVLGGLSGIIEGCAVTSLGANQLQIAAGRGMICGRQFVIEQETINATVSTSGTKLGRLLIQIDIENSTTPISFVTQAETTLPALTQEDINGTGTVYQLPLNTYSISTTTISNLVDVSVDIPSVPAHTHAWTLVATSGTLTGASTLTIPTQVGKSEMMLQFRESTGVDVIATTIVPLDSSGLIISSGKSVYAFGFGGASGDCIDYRRVSSNSATQLAIASSFQYEVITSTYLQKLYVYTR